ncbi:MAG: lipopolysaccharide assembly protein LapA domain-containing protein [Lysobacterales bacterium]
MSTDRGSVLTRWLLLPSAVVVALLSLVFFAMNRDSAVMDLYFARIDLPLGLLVVLCLLGGFVLAGAILFTAVIVPQRLQLRALRRELEQLRRQRTQ